MRLDPLEHVGSQQVFRVLLDVLAEPGTVGELPAGLLDVDVPAAVLAPLALADLEVSLAVLEPAGTGWGDALRAATGARAAPPERADMVLALRPPRPDEVRGLRRGTPDRPDLACRLVLACDRLAPEINNSAGDVLVELTGPGVDGTALLGVGGLPVEVVETLVAVNQRYPLGVDTFLVAPHACPVDQRRSEAGRGSTGGTPAGRVAGLPRSTRVRIRAGAGTWSAHAGPTVPPTGRS